MSCQLPSNWTRRNAAALNNNATKQLRPVKATVPVSLMTQNVADQNSYVLEQGPTTSNNTANSAVAVDPISVKETSDNSNKNDQEGNETAPAYVGPTRGEKSRTLDMRTQPQEHILRRTASVDAIYCSSPLKAETLYIGHFMIDKGTQTPEEWSEEYQRTISQWKPIVANGEQLEVKFIRQKLQRSSQNSKVSSSGLLCCQRQSPVQAQLSSTTIVAQKSSKCYNEILDDSLCAMKCLTGTAELNAICKQEIAERAIKAAADAKITAEVAHKTANNAEKTEPEFGGADALYNKTLQDSLNAMKRLADTAEQVAICKQDAAKRAIKSSEEAKITTEMVRHSATFTNNGSNLYNSSTVAYKTLQVVHTSGPIPIAHGPQYNVPGMPNSIEGFNQEIEKLVLENKVSPSLEGQMSRVLEPPPEGHRAPIAELFHSVQNSSVLAAGRESHGSSGETSSRSHSISPALPIIPGNLEFSISPFSDDMENVHKPGTSPHINYFLSREPPDGCEKVKIIDEPGYPFSFDLFPGHSCQKPKVTYVLLPSQSSAFCPLYKELERSASNPLFNCNTVISSTQTAMNLHN